MRRCSWGGLLVWCLATNAHAEPAEGDTLPGVTDDPVEAPEPPEAEPTEPAEPAEPTETPDDVTTAEPAETPDEPVEEPDGPDDDDGGAAAGGAAAGGAAAGGAAGGATGGGAGGAAGGGAGGAAGGGAAGGGAGGGAAGGGAGGSATGGGAGGGATGGGAGGGATPPPTQSPSSGSVTSSPSPSKPKPQPQPQPKTDRPAKDDESSGRRDSKKDDESEEEEDEDKEPIKHRGFIIDARVGAMGCTGRICGTHDAKTGIRVDGLLGRNLLGFLDLALAGGWGRMGTRIAPGTSGLSLYGLDFAALPEEAQVLPFDGFTVNDATLDSLQAGLDARVHIIPRGRFDPYVGVGLQYSRLRGIYDTPDGQTQMAFHGITFPLQGGFVVFVNKAIAVGAQFDYLWTWYGGMSVSGAVGEFAAPLPILDEATAAAGVKLSSDLPNLWSAGLVLHIRLGK